MLTGVVELRTIEPGELQPFIAALRSCFNLPPASAEELAYLERIVEYDRCPAVFDEGRVVATSGAFGVEWTLPGSVTAPMTAGTWAGVVASHRGRGLHRRLHRVHLEDSHARGEAAYTGFPADGTIYQKFGHGIADFRAAVELPAGLPLARPVPADRRVTCRCGDEALAAIRAVWEHVRPGQPGMTTVTRAMWEVKLADLPDYRYGSLSQQVAICDGPSGPEAFAVYRVRPATDPRRFKGSMQVRTALAATPEAEVALWRHLLDVEGVARIRAENRPLADPLRLIVADPAAVRTEVTDGLWLRIVDVPALLAARRYPRADELVLDVRDDFLEWNDRRFLLAGGPEGAHCRPTGRSPDLALPVADLGACFLGANRFTTLAAAGGVEEMTPGALARADAMFASPVLPWCPVAF